MTRRSLAVAAALAGLLAGTTLSAQRGKPAATAPPAAPKAGAAPVIVFDTPKGSIEIEMYPADAPKSVEHIVDLVRSGFYRGLRVHWVQGIVVQFGDPLTKDMTKRDAWGSGGSGHSVGVAETSKRKFERGSVGLYYQGDYPKAADSQIFILRQANPTLNGKYALIGHVIAGMNVVDKTEVPDRIMQAYVKGEKAK